MLESGLTTELESRYRTAVEKRGKDPHHSFAFMLCDVAMSRAYGTSMVILPDVAPPLPTSPDQLPIFEKIRQQAAEGTCGACANFRSCNDPVAPAKGICAALPATAYVGAPDSSCDFYMPV